MRSKWMIGVVAALGVLVAVPAFAKGDKDAAFPMPAAAFKQKVDAKIGKRREHMEKKASTLPADQAKALRAKFEEGVAKVNAEVAKATADGTVTKEEAKAVRQAAPHRHGSKKHAK